MNKIEETKPVVKAQGGGQADTPVQTKRGSFVIKLNVSCERLSRAKPQEREEVNCENRAMLAVL